MTWGFFAVCSLVFALFLLFGVVGAATGLLQTWP